MRVPKLRFPEFREAPEWEEKQLGNCLSTHPEYGVNEPAVPYSESLPTYLRITDISEDGVFNSDQKVSVGINISNENYLMDGDIVLARTGASVGKSYRYKIADGQLVFAGFLIRIRPDARKASSVFIHYALTSDFYWKWIHVTSARSGQPGINGNEYASFPVLLPNMEEQQKIADCLSSVDEIIAAQSQKLETLKAHKKGLMQQLFPAEGETVPKLRFPEFRDTDEWGGTSLGEIATIASGGTPSRSNKDFWNGNIPWITTSLIDFNAIYDANEYISEIGLKGSSARIFPKKTILMAMYGQGKTRGKVALLGIDAATNQACAAILLNKELDTNFVFQNLASRYDEIRELSNRGGQENLSAGLIEKISFLCPKNKEEQQRIADCLSSLDELIAVQTQKLDTLKAHKKGLMQQLFPSADKVTG